MPYAERIECTTYYSETPHAYLQLTSNTQRHSAYDHGALTLRFVVQEKRDMGPWIFSQQRLDNTLFGMRAVLLP
jgi:hypothetical protein